MMAYFILIVGLLALWHLLWESVIGPSLRTRIRHQVFALRDALGYSGIDQPEAIPADAYQYMEEMLNTSILLLHRFDVVSLIAAQRTFRKDPRFAACSDQRNKVISSCQTTRKVSNELGRLIPRVFVANSGGWFIYLVPVVLMAMCFSTIRSTIHRIVSLPENEIAGRVPEFATMDKGTSLA